MPDIKFTVNDKDYVAHLSHSYISSTGRDKRACTCILTTNNPIHAFAGVAVKNPNDGMKYDENYGYHLAFKRALFYMYIVEKGNIVLHTNVSYDLAATIRGWDKYFQKFRIPFGKALHEWYKDDSDFPF